MKQTTSLINLQRNRHRRNRSSRSRSSHRRSSIRIKNHKKHRYTKKKYQPSINNKLITLKTLVSKTINTKECNVRSLLSMYNKLDTLKLYVNNGCYSFTDPVVINFLLYNLSANKHININKLITPKQYDSNCWFNVMFVTFFISDKGRIFFHFLRQMMIQGIQQNGNKLEFPLWNIFSLLNLYIELCKQGISIARKINTNKIILNLYKIINSTLNIYNISEAGNPLVYYNTIISYLHNTDITLLQVPLYTNWDMSTISFTNNDKPPHIIICEFVPTKYPMKRPPRFTISGYTYELDAACIIDINREHFSSCLHIEGVEYMYDGMSQDRLFKRTWKNLINSTETWSFPGSTNYDETLKRWCFLDSYHSLHYYRTN
jgi:hypothetical protein